jgi:hypothetical protein
MANDIMAASYSFCRDFRYEVWDKGKHLLEDFCSILVARSLRKGL